MSDIGFLSDLLSYYRPRLDVSSLTDEEFVRAIASLLKIREMEKISAVEKVLKNFLE